MDRVAFSGPSAVVHRPQDAAIRTDRGKGFSQYFREAIDEVQRLQTDADRAVRDTTTGNKTDIHGTVIAMEKAGLAFQLMMQVRNKVVAAYEEISRMQV